MANASRTKTYVVMILIALWCGFVMLVHMGGKNSTAGSESKSPVDEPLWDQAQPHTHLTPTGPIPPLTDRARYFLGRRAGAPIPLGNVNVARTSTGYGATICPNLYAYGALVETTLQALDTDIDTYANIILSESTLRRYGCSYFPPGTPMVVEGRDETGLLPKVSVKLSDGTILRGVTTTNQLVETQQQPAQWLNQYFKEHPQSQNQQTEAESPTGEYNPPEAATPDSTQNETPAAPEAPASAPQ